jgi:hypothetical protein
MAGSENNQVNSVILAYLVMEIYHKQYHAMDVGEWAMFWSSEHHL